MGKLVISENVSLDGVAQDATREEGFKQGGWFLQVGIRTVQSGPRSHLRRHCTPRRCCWAGAAMSSSPPGGQRGMARLRTG